MTGTHFAEGQILFREGDRADSVFRVLSGVVDVLRELDGDPILLGTVRAGQFIGEMGVVENENGLSGAAAFRSRMYLMASSARSVMRL